MELTKIETITKRKVLIIGGHMSPALAVAKELQQIEGTKIIWVGHKHSQTGDKSLSAEYMAVIKQKIQFVNLNTGKLWRKWTPATFFKGIVNLAKIPIGFIAGFWILIKNKPDIIISFGGYLSVPIICQLILIKLSHIKVYIHSQTIKPDLATKLTYKSADKVFLTWEQSKEFYKHKNIEVTGNPINKHLQSSLKKSLFDNNLPILLIMGGNQGANTFNRRLRLPILEEYLKTFNVVHQTGASTLTRDFEIAKAQSQKLPNKLRSRYKIYKYIDPKELCNIYNQASLILSRSGANTTQEVMFKGIPAIFMPLPWASADEQLQNAKIVASIGLGAIFLFKDDLSEEQLFQAVLGAFEQVQQKESFKKGTSWQEAKLQAKAMIKPNAASDIARIITNGQ